MPPAIARGIVAFSPIEPPTEEAHLLEHTHARRPQRDRYREHSTRMLGKHAANTRHATRDVYAVKHSPYSDTWRADRRSGNARELHRTDHRVHTQER